MTEDLQQHLDDGKQRACDGSDDKNEQYGFFMLQYGIGKSIHRIDPFVLISNSTLQILFRKGVEIKLRILKAKICREKEKRRLHGAFSMVILA